MANKSVVLYQYVKIRRNWKFIAAVEPLKRLTKGAYYVSWYEGKVKQWENVGREPEAASRALEKKRLEMAFVAAGGEVKEIRRPQEPKSTESVRNQETKPAPVRIRLSDAVAKYLERCRARQGKSGYGMAGGSVGAYEYRLGFLLEFRPPTEEREKDREIYLDEVDKDFLYGFLGFLRNHKSRLADRTCYNIMQAVSTFLIHYGNRSATGVLKEIGFPPTEVIPYANDELRSFFAVCTRDEDLLFKFFLHTMARDMEVAHCEVRDVKFEKSAVHISPKPDKGFRLKGKRSGQNVKGRFVPIPRVLLECLRIHCQGKPSRTLLFPCRHGGVNYHFLRICKRIAKRAGLPNWEEFNLHRWRKTGATRYHESGVSLRTLQYRLGHESLDVTILYLGIQDAAEQSSMDLVNSGLLAAFI